MGVCNLSSTGESQTGSRHWWDMAWAVAFEVLYLLNISLMNLDGRFTFHIQLGKLRSERLNDPVLVAWRGSSTARPIIY